MNATIEHQPGQDRFETGVGDLRAWIEYRLQPGVMTITHTEVPAALEGQGIAGQLVEAALDHARSQGLKVNPSCSFARAYMQRHPETMAVHV